MKLLAFILCVAMVFSIVGCSQQADTLSNPDAVIVWIPTVSGHKYHSNPRCSNMKNPKQTTLTEAINAGFSECLNCH